VFYLFEIYILVWGAGSTITTTAVVSRLVSIHVDNFAATKQNKSFLPHPNLGLFYMDDEYDFCQEDIAKGGELLSQMGGVLFQEECRNPTLRQV